MSFLRLRVKILIVVLSLGVGLFSGCGGGRQQPQQQAPPMDAESKARMAESLLNAGRTSESLATIDEAIADEPDNATLHHFRGTILLRAGRFVEAEQAFKQVLELDPYFTDAHNFLGVVYSELGRYNEAEAEYRMVLNDPAYPTPELAYLNLGRLYEEQGRDDEALPELRRAVEIDPKFYQAHYQLASLLDRMGRLGEAVRIYQVAEPGYRASAEYHYRLGVVYFRLGEHEDAKESLRKAMDVGPGSESAAQADELLRMID